MFLTKTSVRCWLQRFITQNVENHPCFFWTKHIKQRSSIHSLNLKAFHHISWSSFEVKITWIQSVHVDKLSPQNRHGMSHSTLVPESSQMSYCHSNSVGSQYALNLKFRIIFSNNSWQSIEVHLLLLQLFCQSLFRSDLRFSVHFGDGKYGKFHGDHWKKNHPGRLTAGTCPPGGLVQIIFLSFHGWWL